MTLQHLQQYVAENYNLEDNLKTGYEWAEIKGVRVIDPDGWRNDDKTMADEITKKEFNQRLLYSTITMI